MTVQSDFLRVRPKFEERILDLGTLGDAMFQEQVDRVIRQCHKRSIGAISVLDFVSWTGDAYHLNRMTPGPDAIAIDDTDKLDCAYPDPDCAEAAYAKTSFDFKTYWICGNLTRRAIRRSAGYADLLAIELAHSAERMIYTQEKQIFQGNLNGAAPKEFDGLFELILAYNGATPGLPVQVLVADGAVLDPTPGSTVPGDLTLKLLDQLLDELKTGPKVIFVSKTGRRIVRGLLQAQQQFNDTMTVGAGFEVESYFGSPIVTTDGIPDDLVVIDDGAGNPTIDALSGGESTAIVAINTDEVFMAELTPMTVEPLAKCVSERQAFNTYWDGCLVLACPEGAAMILAIDPAC